MTYTSSRWASAVEKVSVRQKLGAVQQGFAQKIIKSYRTVSLNASLILGGLLALDSGTRSVERVL